MTSLNEIVSGGYLKQACYNNYCFNYVPRQLRAHPTTTYIKYIESLMGMLHAYAWYSK
jgi:hypothetical protein